MTKKITSVLVIGAHPDDDVLGCGGTIAKLSKKPSIKINTLFISNGIDSRKGNKRVTQKNILIRKKAAQKACKILGSNSPYFADLADNQLDKYPLLKIVKIIEKYIIKFKPEIIFTHFYNDLNIDHQIVNKAAVTASRPQNKSSVKTLFFFEVPSSTEWKIDTKLKMFNPNWFEDITKFKKVKLQALKAYKTELRSWPHPRSLKGVDALISWRGATVGVEAAEAFVLGRKIS
jgi:N-acetylglucosamine malate deacetylase 1